MARSGKYVDFARRKVWSEAGRPPGWFKRARRAVLAKQEGLRWNAARAREEVQKANVMANRNMMGARR